MRLPSEKETVEFFESVGRRLERCKGQHGEDDYWYLTRPGAPGGRKLDSLVQAWASWLPHAAHIVIEDVKLRRFMQIYSRAGVSRKAELRAAVDAFCAWPANREPLSPFTEDPYSRSIDYLPRDWKARVRRIMAQPGGDTYFPERARLALAALDLEN